MNAVTEFEPHETKATHEFMYRLVHAPDDFVDHIRLMSGSLMMVVTYGIDVRSLDDPYLIIVGKAIEALDVGLAPASFLVDNMPWLKYVPEWVPGAGFKRMAREWRKHVEATAHVPFQYVKDAMAKCVHTTSMTSRALNRIGEHGDAEAEGIVRATSAASFIGGSDTVSFQIHSKYLVMSLSLCSRSDRICYDQLLSRYGPVSEREKEGSRGARQSCWSRPAARVLRQTIPTIHYCNS